MNYDKSVVKLSNLRICPHHPDDSMQNHTLEMKEVGPGDTGERKVPAEFNNLEKSQS